MATKIVIDGDKLAEEIAEIRGKVKRMQQLLDDINTVHFYGLKTWRSPASEMMLGKYSTLVGEIMKTIDGYNTFVTFLNSVAEQYGLTEHILKLEKQSASAFEG